MYVPRRAVVARAVRPASAEAPYSAADRTLVGRLAELLRAGEDEVAARAAAPDDVRRYWFPGDGVRWGISPERQQAFLRWAEGIV